jgi:hypothetical protein
VGMVVRVAAVRRSPGLFGPVRVRKT